MKSSSNVQTDMGWTPLWPWIAKQLADSLLAVADIAHHAPLGSADPVAKTGWSFVLAADIGGAPLYRVINRTFILPRFCRIFHLDPHRSEWFWSLRIHLPTRQLQSDWWEVTPTQFERRVSWNTVWMHLVLGPPIPEVPPLDVMDP